MPYTAHDPVYLSALSPRDARFDRHKAETEKFCLLYQLAGYQGYFDRMRHCAAFLDFSLEISENGVLIPRLQGASFCRVRLCPTCQWRRSVMWQAKAFQVIPKVIEDYPKSRFIFLTLTVRNCQLGELRNTLAWMHDSWRKLVMRKEFKLVQGWIRSVEVTRSADDTAHPHYHALLMVKPSYFSTGYVSQARWTEVWQSCLGVNYAPIVDVRSVRPGKAEKGSEGVLLSSVICEVVKYSVKPSECLREGVGFYMSNHQWLAGLTEQLHKTRAIATGGVLKKYLSDLEKEPEDLIHADEDGFTPVDEESPRMAFSWHRSLNRYVMTDAS